MPGLNKTDNVNLRTIIRLQSVDGNKVEKITFVANFFQSSHALNQGMQAAGRKIMATLNTESSGSLDSSSSIIVVFVQ